MNTLIIKMRPDYRIRNASVFIDGEKVNLKKSGNGEYSCRCETENDSVELTVCKFFEINGKFWFLYSLLFFFISVLGIFDARYDKNCYCLKYKIFLRLSGENTVNLKFNTFKEGNRAIECAADCPSEEYENEYFTDKQAKKRLKTMRIVKLLIWLTAIVTAVVIVIVKVVIG